MGMAKFPTMDEFAKAVAEKALDDFEYEGKTIREWAHLILSGEVVPVVRCDDCIHYRPPDEGDFLGLCTSGMVAVSHDGEIYPGRGFYCLYGERKKL